MATTAASYRKPILTTTEFAEISALESDLAALCREGMLEAFEDEHGIVRYQPTTKAIERIA